MYLHSMQNSSSQSSQIFTSFRFSLCQHSMHCTLLQLVPPPNGIFTAVTTPAVIAGVACINEIAAATSLALAIFAIVIAPLACMKAVEHCWHVHISQQASQYSCSHRTHHCNIPRKDSLRLLLHSLGCLHCLRLLFSGILIPSRDGGGHHRVPGYQNFNSISGRYRTHDGQTRKIVTGPTWLRESLK